MQESDAVSINLLVLRKYEIFRLIPSVLMLFILLSPRYQQSCSQLRRVKGNRKISDIRRTKFQNWNVANLVLQLSLPNSLKPGVKQIMKM